MRFTLADRSRCGALTSAHPRGGDCVL